MKNIHVLPTENESRIRYNSFNKVYELCEFPKYHTDIKSTHNIYITSDEEIKEGDWYLNIEEYDRIKNPFYGKLYKANQSIKSVSTEYKHNLKKIILTTDQDLIKDGVQAIDDEFLEWFVKNPTCEEVETVFNNRGITGAEKILKTFGEYKIIIPKEEAMNMKEEFEKSVNIIDDWLEKNGDPEIDKQVEQEAKELCEQNKISEEELERVISAPINLYSVIKYLFNKFKKIRYVR